MKERSMSAPALAPRHRVTLVGVGVDRWRAVSAAAPGMTGTVIGHLERREHRSGARFAALRYHAASGGFRDLGEFHCADDAVDCLR